MRTNFLKDEKGTAIFIAVMMLTLGTGLGLLAFQAATTELQISNYVGTEAPSTYLAESGVDKVIYWIGRPERSPDPVFFGSLSKPETQCSHDSKDPDFKISDALLNDTVSGPFSELREMGKIVDLRLYKPSYQENGKEKGICVIESRAQGGAGAARLVRVEITRSPLRAITAGIQGPGTGASPVWAHWGIIRYAGDANLGPMDKVPAQYSKASLDTPYDPQKDNTYNKDRWLDIYLENLRSDKKNDVPNNVHPGSTVTLETMDPIELKGFALKYGSYYVISPTGKLEQADVVKGAFDEVFNKPGKDFGLVYIDRTKESAKTLTIDGGSYKGLFYIAGDVRIRGGESGQVVEATPPPVSEDAASSQGTSNKKAVSLNVNLEGLLYVNGHVTLQGHFSIYGSAYAGEGFTDPGRNSLEVWYNNDFKSGAYAGLPSIIRLKGTWRSSPPSSSGM